MSSPIRGKAFVVKDNIDTDQIIPAEFLMLVPTVAEEYEKLGSHAMAGLPESLYPTRFIPAGEIKTPYKIVIAGRNFGCGSSREHAPISMGGSGCEVVVAESFARIFFRNCIATGELYPCETPQRLVEKIQTGDEVEIDLDQATLKEIKTGTVYSLKPLGDAKPVIDAGGIFDYARQTGMIPAR